jgi:hypothetical protein
MFIFIINKKLFLLILRHFSNRIKRSKLSSLLSTLRHHQFILINNTFFLRLFHFIIIIFSKQFLHLMVSIKISPILRIIIYSCIFTKMNIITFINFLLLLIFTIPLNGLGILLLYNPSQSNPSNHG